MKKTFNNQYSGEVTSDNPISDATHADKNDKGEIMLNS